MMCPNEANAGTRSARLRALSLAALAGCALLLGGCMNSRETTASVPGGYQQRHPISIKEGERNIELLVGTNRGGLNAGQRADVAAFAHAWRREATGGIIIEAPTGTNNARAASEMLPEIQSILMATGVPANVVRLRHYRPADPRQMATLRINYSKMVAETGPCGTWPEDLGLTYDSNSIENREYHNLGCATQRNLAAMIDNPSDLVQPRGETPSYSARRTVMFDKYRKGESPGSTDANADKGKISEIGK
ncbi:MAG: pilus assembly protein CpaD [Xanthobacteraceae bacterium]|jgi:pilus assembly protein CpaD|nr:pilus assembly protein CpaD [Xanthobacteraceae bacterium]